MSEEVWEVWGAYHERERLCPEGVRVREIAHVHYAVRPTASISSRVQDIFGFVPTRGNVYRVEKHRTLNEITVITPISIK